MTDLVIPPSEPPGPSLAATSPRPVFTPKQEVGAYLRTRRLTETRWPARLGDFARWLESELITPARDLLAQPHAVFDAEVIRRPKRPVKGLDTGEPGSPQILAHIDGLSPETLNYAFRRLADEARAADDFIQF